ncbi:hypothetical protein LZ012_11775 [Dechloromonas sp. XY25]|uniref:Uncharacterized protein n=1 Tax=Dechloromonas hankyongensis TaxID=2908002 RepID=A0ABS9K3B3_9RHOO|nr:hypothetical protein [Dechloromonas hankyongensis]MCG2577672.1 hypothetical protein [Dechloromonas hankyongensis]
MWPTLFKVVGGSLLTFALVWALVLGWWQSNDYEPSRLDLGLYLAALPLALVGGFLLLRGFIDHLKAPAEAAPPAAAALRDDDPLAIASAQTTAAERAFTIALIDGFVLTAGGGSADGTLAAVEDGKRPEPSARLADEAGFPVFAAEVPELEVDAMIERISEENGPLRDWAGREQIMRSFSLLERVIEASGDRLRNILEQAGESVGLRVVWIVPAAWQGMDLQAMKAWLQASFWPDPDKNRLDIAAVPVAGEVDALRVLDDIILRAGRDPSRGELTLLLGAASVVDEQSVEQWAAANRLFSAQHQQRRIPGEGGVALLLASQATAERLELAESVAVGRISAAPRDKPVDAGGRISGKLIEQLVTGLLDVTGIEDAAIKTAVLDTDHRANHLTEALEGLGQHFGHLDPIKNCLAVASTTGDLSPIGGLVALACAKARVLATEAPVLCISNQHDIDRAVLLAMPLPAQPDIKPSST